MRAEKMIKIDASERGMRELIRRAIRAEIVLSPDEEREIEDAFLKLVEKLAAHTAKAA